MSASSAEVNFCRIDIAFMGAESLSEAVDYAAEREG